MQRFCRVCVLSLTFVMLEALVCFVVLGAYLCIFKSEMNH